MNNNIINRLKSFIGFGSYLDEEDELLMDYNKQQGYQSEGNAALDTAPVSSPRRQQSLKVVQHPGSNRYEVMVIEPKSFDESLEIVDYLRMKRSIILNLHLVDEEQAQRIVDFLSGATHALDGSQQKIGEGVFIFTPCNVNLYTDNESGKQNSRIQGKYALDEGIILTSSEL